MGIFLNSVNKITKLFSEFQDKDLEVVKNIRLIMVKSLEIINLYEATAQKADTITSEILLNLASTENEIQSELQSLLTTTLPNLQQKKVTQERQTEIEVEKTKIDTQQPKKQPNKGLNIETPKKEVADTNQQQKQQQQQPQEKPVEQPKKEQEPQNPAI